MSAPQLNPRLRGNLLGSPIFKFLRCHCRVCRSPLIDAVSIEMGLGPGCRVYGSHLSVGVSPSVKRRANLLLRHVAGQWFTYRSVPDAEIAELVVLGFQGLVRQVLDATSVIWIQGRVFSNHWRPGYGREAPRLCVRTPYRPEAVVDLRSIPERAWDSTLGVNVFPFESRGARRAVWAWLRRWFPGLEMRVNASAQRTFTLPWKDSSWAYGWRTYRVPGTPLENLSPDQDELDYWTSLLGSKEEEAQNV